MIHIRKKRKWYYITLHINKDMNKSLLFNLLNERAVFDSSQKHNILSSIRSIRKITGIKKYIYKQKDGLNSR